MNKSFFALFACLLILSGCDTIKKAYQEEVTALPGYALTNADGTITIIPSRLNTNLVARPGVERSIGVARDLGTATGIPWAGAIGTVLLAVYVGVAKVLNKKASDKWKTVAEVLVDNVETARDVIKSFPTSPGDKPGVAENETGKEIDKDLVAKMVDSQNAAGVRTEINKIVRDVT